MLNINQESISKELIWYKLSEFSTYDESGYSRQDHISMLFFEHNPTFLELMYLNKNYIIPQIKTVQYYFNTDYYGQPSQNTSSNYIPFEDKRDDKSLVSPFLTHKEHNLVYLKKIDNSEKIEEVRNRLKTHKKYYRDKLKEEYHMLSGPFTSEDGLYGTGRRDNPNNPYLLKAYKYSQFIDLEKATNTAIINVLRITDNNIHTVFNSFLDK